MSWLLDLVTERDNSTVSFVRVSTVLVVVAGVVLSAVSVSAGHPFDANGFWLGAAAVIAGGGVGVRAAREREG